MTSNLLARSRTGSRRLISWLVVLVLGAQFIPRAAAHAGTTHAGTPHWLLLVFVIVGLAVGLYGHRLFRRQRLSWIAGIGVMLSGGVLAGFGGIGLVEIQVVSLVGPSLRDWYPIGSYLIGIGVLVGSLLAGLRYWPTQPAYTLLGVVLGAWILYPTMMPNGGLWNPIGYAIVLSLPLIVGYIIWDDAHGSVARALSRWRTRALALITAGLMTVFLAFSTGTLTVNPDWGVAGAPSNGFLVTLPVGSPLVMWPAVEIYLPQIPIGGMISVGTILLFSLLSGLVGLNLAVTADQWTGRTSTDGSPRRSLLGTLSVSGTTACCCCAPAFYGVLSAVFGTTATPIYWAFMDPTSPLGSTFLALSVVILTSSIVRSSPPNAENQAACDVSPAA